MKAVFLCCGTLEKLKWAPYRNTRPCRVYSFRSKGANASHRTYTPTEVTIAFTQATKKPRYVTRGVAAWGLLKQHRNCFIDEPACTGAGGGAPVQDAGSD